MKVISSSKRYRFLLTLSTFAVFSHFLLLIKGPATDASSIYLTILTGKTCLWSGTIFCIIITFYTWHGTSFSDYCSKRPADIIENSILQENPPPVIDPEERAKYNSWLFTCAGALFALEFDLLWIAIRGFSTIWALWDFEQDGTLTTACRSTILLGTATASCFLCVGGAGFIVFASIGHLVSIGEQAGYVPLELIDKDRRIDWESRMRSSARQTSVFEPD